MPITHLRWQYGLRLRHSLRSSFSPAPPKSAPAMYSTSWYQLRVISVPFPALLKTKTPGSSSILHSPSPFFLCHLSSDVVSSPFRIRDKHSAYLLDHHPGLAHLHLSPAAALTLYKKKEPLLLTSRLPPQEPSNLPPKYEQLP